MNLFLITCFFFNHFQSGFFFTYCQPLLSFSVAQKVQGELEGLKKDLKKVSVKTQEVLSSPQPAASAPVLRSELDLTVQKMDHAYMLSSIYLDK